MNPGDDDDLFLEAMRGVEPLADRERVRVTQERPAVATLAADPSFVVENREGRAHGVSRQQLATLRSGAVVPERVIDLHGLRAKVARDVIARRVRAAAADGVRCLLLVHGRGKRSGPGGAVLADLAAEVLSTGATARLVRAFCRARPADGGDGAMYVLLAR